MQIAERSVGRAPEHAIFLHVCGCSADADSLLLRKEAQAGVCDPAFSPVLLGATLSLLEGTSHGDQVLDFADG